MTTPHYPQWQPGDAQDPGAWQQPPTYGPPYQQPYQPQQAYQPQQPYQPQQAYQPQQPYQPPSYGAPLPPPGPVAPARSRGKLIGASAAVVLLAGGGVASYVAFSSSTAAGGAGSPKAAVQRAVTDLNNSDLAGFLDDLAPGERDAISAPVKDAMHKLQDTKVLRPGTSLKKVDGVDVSATGLTFAGQTITINDHVQIVLLTGGTLHLSADASRLPFTAEFLHAVAPNGLPADDKVDETLDIGAQVRRTGKPIRIATEKVGGRWYPSLFYTIADNITTEEHLTAPTPAQRIPDAGAASADEAVRELVEDLLGGQVEQSLELLSPDELGVVHDYGKLIVDRAHYSPAPVTVKDLEFSDVPISGAVRVTLKSIDLVDRQGHEFRATMSGSCLTITSSQRTQRLCASSLVDEAAGATGGGELTAEQRTALTDLTSGLTQVGLDAAQVGGKWYVEPVRSYLGLTGTLLSGLKGDDLLVLAKLFGGH